MAEILARPSTTLEDLCSSPARSRPLPGRLRNSGDLSPQCQLPEAQPAYAKLPQETPRTSAELAAVMLSRGKLGLPRLVLV